MTAATPFFGLVFGLAATAPDALTLLVAGATGAAAAALSMMAGTFLDVESPRDRARAQLEETRERINWQATSTARSERMRLEDMWFSEVDARAIVDAMQRTPNAAVNFESAFALQIGAAASRNPLVQSIWMFVADLFAMKVLVVPFARFPLEQARVVSVSTVPLLVLRLGRGLVGRRKVIFTMLETLVIAAAAAGAGLVSGELLTYWAGRAA